MNGQPAEQPFIADCAIIAFWRSRRTDTFRIAQLLKVHESVIANRLAQLRDQGAV